ncbi:SulP family inorganic anion transporter [Pseudomonas aeruginosa]|uniref:SulP family inorganic anion transporter n=1 Tax=Pseudomonas aeruginosa TaxID=287 RepID=UPI000F526292|nr:SulP family inorganic anion transporter [Pseudomonas aeruginosa]RPX23919.1 sodium-independent anion transporter [Pseudomonas aeruginosa]RPX84018.1 sodium-independent anion transporter [Pseudomonas aeruginosa]WCW27739.1 SulP family inorganic anion transporter [Pseudomonas aeruginosa]HEJ6031881.1 SulP family inorganic anion transporter [Pseudomonas aeruginosa]
MLQTLKQNWFSNLRGDLLAGLVVALALIPEAIAFSIIAGVDPKIGLYASFSMAVVIAFAGGRPGMISAATGAMALLMVNLVKDHGLQYLLAATLLCGVLQILAGYLRLGSLMRFVSRSVVTGFVNALAILIFMAQLPELTDVGWPVYAMTAAGLAIVYGFPQLPRIGRLLPSPLVCILVLTGISIYLGLDIRTVGDMGQLPDSLPLFLWPDVPLNLDTLLIVLPYSAALLGGMAGCAMIGQSVINVKSGGRSRLSTLVAGVALLLMVVFLSDWVGRIPMAALVAVMIMVSIGTFRWESIRNLKRYPLSTNLVMLVTVGVVLATHNLAFGVVAGVLLASLFFANKIGHYLDIDSERSADGTRRHYQVSGQVFFASSDRFIAAFDLRETLEHVLIDLRHAHLWDVTAVAALDKVVLGFRQRGVQVDVLGLNAASATLVDRFGAYDKPGAVDILPGH